MSKSFGFQLFSVDSKLVMLRCNLFPICIDLFLTMKIFEVFTNNFGVMCYEVGIDL